MITCGQNWEHFLFVIAVNLLLFVTEFNRYVIKGEIKPIGDFLYLLLFRK